MEPNLFPDRTDWSVCRTAVDSSDGQVVRTEVRQASEELKSSSRHLCHKR
jgi:hypothetical protein